MAAILGIAEHNGWAEFVAVGVRDTAPIVHARYRVKLRDTSLPSQPYHHEALEMPLSAAQDLVDRVRHSMAQHARATLSEAQSRFSVLAIVLQKSPFDQFPESLADVLSSWRMTCAADGMMYREALADAAVELGMDAIRYPRKSNAIQIASDQFGVEPEKVALLVKDLGKPLGTPWREEHRRATAMALWALARYTDVHV